MNTTHFGRNHSRCLAYSRKALSSHVDIERRWRRRRWQFIYLLIIIGEREGGGDNLSNLGGLWCAIERFLFGWIDVSSILTGNGNIWMCCRRSLVSDSWLLFLLLYFPAAFAATRAHEFLSYRNSFTRIGRRTKRENGLAFLWAVKVWSLSSSSISAFHSVDHARHSYLLCSSKNRRFCFHV